MSYMISYETLNACILLIGMLFIACVACEWLKDDMKYLYQGLTLLTNSAIALIMGFELMTGNIWYGGLGGMQFDPLGWVLIFVGAMSFILLIIVWLPKIGKPYDVHAGRIPRVAVQPLNPQEPRQPGRF